MRERRKERERRKGIRTEEMVRRLEINIKRIEINRKK